MDLDFYFLKNSGLFSKNKDLKAQKRAKTI